jgi:hypothetical protein
MLLQQADEPLSDDCVVVGQQHAGLTGHSSLSDANAGQSARRGVMPSISDTNAKNMSSRSVSMMKAPHVGDRSVLQARTVEARAVSFRFSAPAAAAAVTGIDSILCA